MLVRRKNSHFFPSSCFLFVFKLSTVNYWFLFNTFFFIFRCIKPHLKSFALGIYTLAIRVLGKSSCTFGCILIYASLIIYPRIKIWLLERTRSNRQVNTTWFKKKKIGKVLEKGSSFVFHKSYNCVLGIIKIYTGNVHRGDKWSFGLWS